MIIALGMMLLVEGVVPAFFPRQWREVFSRLIRFSDGQIRFLGLVALISGFIILALPSLFF
ncbi:MAG TPA: DUF2065 domain-containing protein [Noviherbaspirillum sp.]